MLAFICSHVNDSKYSYLLRGAAYSRRFKKPMMTGRIRKIKKSSAQKKKIYGQKYPNR